MDRSVTTRRVLYAAFPASARTWGAEPKTLALVVMVFAGVVAAMGVVVYAMWGSNCGTEVVALTENPRQNCIPRAFTREELDSIVPSPPATTQACSQSPSLMMLQFGLESDYLRVYEPVCALANASFSATLETVATSGISTVGDGETHHLVFRQPSGDVHHNFSFFMPLDLEGGSFDHKCSGPGWSLFFRDGPSLARTVYFLFVDDLKVVFGKPTDVDVSDAYLSFAPLEQTFAVLTYNAGIGSASVNERQFELLVNETASTTGASFVSVRDQLGSWRCGSCKNVEGNDCLGVNRYFRFTGGELHHITASAGAGNPSGLRKAFQRLHSSSRVMWWYPSQTGCASSVHVTIEEGRVVPLFCPVELCDTLLQRVADALALAIGAFGAMSFIVRALPVCHRRTHRVRHTVALLPLEGSSIGKRPLFKAVVLVFAVELMVCAGGLAYVVFGSACESSFLFVPTDGVADKSIACVPRDLDRVEAQAVYRETSADSEQVFSDAKLDDWLKNCDDPAAASKSAVFDLRFPFAISTGISALSTELCSHATRVNISTRFDNVAGVELGRGVRIHIDGVPSFESARMKHVEGAIRAVCGAELWTIVEISELLVTRVLVLTRGDPWSQSSILLAQRDLTEQFFFDNVAAAELNPEQLEFGAPLRPRGRVQDIALSDVPGRTFVTLGLSIGRRDAPSGSISSSEGQVGVYRFELVAQIDLNLSIAINTDSITRLDTALQSISAATTHTNSSFGDDAAATDGTCIRIRVPISQGGGKVRAWCRDELCDSMTLRLATASSVGFALLTAVLFIVRLSPCLHVWDGRRATRNLPWLYQLFPSSGTPINHRPQQGVAVFLILFQFAAILVAAWWAFSQERCFSGFDAHREQPRLGCARPKLASEDLHTLFGKGANSRYIDMRASGDDVLSVAAESSFPGFFTIDTIDELADASTGANLLAQRMCAAFGDPGVTVTHNEEQTQWTTRFASNQSLIASWSVPSDVVWTNQSIQACASADVALWQHEPSKILLMVRSMTVRNVLMSTDVMVTRLMALVETSETEARLNVSVLPGLIIQPPVTASLRENGSVWALRGVDNVPEHRFTAADQTPLWGVEFGMAGLSTTKTNMRMLEPVIQGLRWVVVYASSTSGGNSRPVYVSPRVQNSDKVALYCVVETCDTLLSRSATAAAFAIAIVAIVVFAVRKSPFHISLPLPELRKSLTMAPGWTGFHQSSSQEHHQQEGAEEEEEDGEEEDGGAADEDQQVGGVEALDSPVIELFTVKDHQRNE